MLAMFFNIPFAILLSSLAWPLKRIAWFSKPLTLAEVRSYLNAHRHCWFKIVQGDCIVFAQFSFCFNRLNSSASKGHCKKVSSVQSGTNIFTKLMNWFMFLNLSNNFYNLNPASSWIEAGFEALWLKDYLSVDFPPKIHMDRDLNLWLFSWRRIIYDNETDG